MSEFFASNNETTVVSETDGTTETFDQAGDETYHVDTRATASASANFRFSGSVSEVDSASRRFLRANINNSAEVTISLNNVGGHSSAESVGWVNGNRKVQANGRYGSNSWSGTVDSLQSIRTTNGSYDAVYDATVEVTIKNVGATIDSKSVVTEDIHR